MIKLIIAGTRNFHDFNLLEKEVVEFLLENNFNPQNLIIISGKAQGADTLGEEFAKKYGFKIDPYPAKWDDFTHPRSVKKFRMDGTPYNVAAGHIRNEEMAKNATHVIIFWDGKSKGSLDMIKNSKKYNLIYKIIKYE